MPSGRKSGQDCKRYVRNMSNSLDVNVVNPLDPSETEREREREREREKGKGAVNPPFKTCKISDCYLRSFSRVGNSRQI